MKRKLFILAAGLACSSVSLEATLVEFDFEGETQSPSLTAEGALASDFNLSSGAASFPAGNGSADSISENGWNQTEGGKGWQFTLSPENPGDRLNLSQISFDDRASGTGPQQWSLTVNGVPVAANQSTHDEFGSSPMNTVDLGDIAFQMLNQAEFQIFGFDAPSSSGTWRLDNVSVEGSLAAVPEPGEYAAIAGLALLAFAAFRKRIPAPQP